ncbi:MAG: tRNA (adenosine(37)-N6)-dimethylallyltransferase MiaA [Melioribacteraceae bacterium]|nr:tRNA (adenosine(37)-N6)-dimethylallyltransferase MiaA [Melioribacteraceae bacterium]
MERKVIVIVGPTCSGKTKVSLDLARRLSTEIISADSRQIYKYLNIGTAKPVLEDLKSVKHHFINYIEPGEEYNVSRYESDGLKIIEDNLSKGQIPIVVGGSGLYIHAIVDGIFDAVDTDEEYRDKLKENREKLGNQFLYDELKKVDPKSASKMLPQNWKRVMRALEVYHLTGKPIWKFQQEHNRESNISFVQFGLEWQREVLYQNINNRVDKMIETGFVNEVEKILEMGYSKKLNSLNTVGYKEIISYLENEICLERAIELIKRNTRHYAKRQMTWFRKDDRINWMKINSKNDLEKVPDLIISQISNLN